LGNRVSPRKGKRGGGRKILLKIKKRTAPGRKKGKKRVEKLRGEGKGLSTGER